MSFDSVEDTGVIQVSKRSDCCTGQAKQDITLLTEGSRDDRTCVALLAELGKARRPNFVTPSHCILSQHPDLNLQAKSLDTKNILVLDPQKYSLS